MVSCVWLGSRFHRRTRRPVEFDGNAGILEWSVEFGSASWVHRGTGRHGFLWQRGHAIEWSVEFGTATASTVAPDVPEFFGNATTAEWSASVSVPHLGLL